MVDILDDLAKEATKRNENTTKRLKVNYRKLKAAGFTPSESSVACMRGKKYIDDLIAARQARPHIPADWHPNP